MITKQKIDELHELLWHQGYRRLELHRQLFSDEYECVDVHCTALTIPVHEDAIKDLLGGMGYTISSDKDRETITIK
jgi:hypothetical protein